MTSANAVAEDKVKTSTTLWELLRRLWPYFMRQKWLFAATITAVLALSVVGRLLPYLFGHGVDEGILKNDYDKVTRVALFYFGLEVIKTVLIFLHGFLFAKIGNRILFELRDRLIDHTQSLPIPFFDKNPTGRIVTRVTNDVVSLGELFTQGIISLFSNVLTLATIVAAMMLISVKMTVVTLCAAPPLIALGLFLSRKIREVLRESKKKLAMINSFVAENINGMKVLQLYRRVGKNTRKFERLSGEYREVQMKSVTLYALLWPTVNFFNAASVAVALYYGGLVTIDGAISTGAMIAFIIHVRDFIHPLRTILEKYQMFQNSLSGAERIFTLLDEAPESREGRSLPAGRLRGRIEFKGLKFRYSPDLPCVLDDINLVIEPGQSVALVGRTGSGKSTMIALLQRFYDYSEGEILVDGVALSEIARRGHYYRLCQSQFRPEDEDGARVGMV